jgi:predicted lipoprotein with Yx(FWY)xxD motif
MVHPRPLPKVPAARRTVRLAAATMATGLLFAGGALAAHSSSTVGARPVPKLGKTVAVDSRGMTLYSLSTETTKHLLCSSGACTAEWPPLTVASRHSALKAGKAVHGKLGVFRRSNGTWQVTINGRPAYRFSGDSKPGDANGQGIKDFGGTWHAILASNGAAVASSPGGSGGYGSRSGY